MFQIKVKTDDAAHQLLKHKGKCKNLHGHTYCLEVSVAGKINSKTGMIKWIWSTLVKAFKKQGVALYMIKLWETPTSCVVYKKD